VGGKSFCCENQWDNACVGIAEFLCLPKKLVPRAYHVVTANGVDESVRIDGFTIAKGLADGFEYSNGIGAGMLILDSSPAIVRVTFLENAAPEHGGGAMYILGNSNPMVVNTSFIQNTGYRAGAMLNDFDIYGVTFVNCLFRENSSYWLGGAITSVSSGTFTFLNCTFADNSALLSSPSAGAVFKKGAGPFSLTNCILWGNFAGEIPKQIIDANEVITLAYCDIQDGWTGIENIDEDPLFVDADNGNYRLQLGSPCFDSGDPDEKVILPDIFDVDQDKDETERTPDLDLIDRIVNGIVDMGAYEIPCPWDLDNSGSVDTNDLLALFAQWGTDGSADFDSNDIVNTADMLILFANWGSCK